MILAKKSRLVRVEQDFINLFNDFKKEGKVNNFPEFSRLIVNDVRVKKKNLRFFK